MFRSGKSFRPENLNVYLSRCISLDRYARQSVVRRPGRVLVNHRTTVVTMISVEEKPEVEPLLLRETSYRCSRTQLHVQSESSCKCFASQPDYYCRTVMFANL